MKGIDAVVLAAPTCSDLWSGLGQNATQSYHGEQARERSWSTRYRDQLAACVGTR
jgi:hypothetical protein